MIIGISGKLGSGKDTAADIIQKLYPFFLRKLFADKLKDFTCSILGCTREELENREFKEDELEEEWWYYESYSGEKVNYLDVEDHDKFDSLSWELIKLTPRRIMQLVGTEVRNLIHPNLWVNAMFQDYRLIGIRSEPLDSPHNVGSYDMLTFPNWIITDVRFPQEAKAIEERGGILIRIERDTELRFPEFWKEFQESGFEEWDAYLMANGQYARAYHASETSLDNYEFDHIIQNNDSLEELEDKIKTILNGKVIS